MFLICPTIYFMCTVGFLYVNTMQKGGNSMKRVYITAVKPLENYVLQVDFVSKSRLLLDMSEKIDLLRFRPLKKLDIWNSVTTNGIFVRFGDIEVAHDEILTMVEEVSKTESNKYEN